MIPLVSVIIPTHNRPQFVKHAIQSVLTQSMTDLELIVVENGESTGGEGVVNKFRQTDSRVRYLYQSRPDPSLARNAGVEMSTGKYIAFLDDDDEWLPTKIERQVAVLEHSPEAGLVACGAYRTKSSGEVVTEWPDFHEYPAFKYLVMEGCVIRSLSGVMIRWECFQRVGLFNSSYFIANDYDFYLRLARITDFTLIQEPLYRYVQHAGSMSRHLIEAWKESISVLQSTEPSRQFGVTRRAIHRRIAKYYHSMAVEALDKAQYRQAAKWHFSAVCFDPLIGSQISWGRLSNPMYRILRPYVAFLRCGWLGLGIAWGKPR